MEDGREVPAGDVSVNCQHMDNIKALRLNEVTNGMSGEKRRSLSSEAARGLTRS